MLLPLLLSTGCAHHPAPLDRVAWDLQPRVVEGDIRVAPAIVVAPDPELDLTDVVGYTLLDERAEGRRARTRELSELPWTLRDAVPGVLNATLPPDWSGHFRDTDLAPADRAAITRALRGEASLEASLARAARGAPGDATLFVWVLSTEGEALTASNLVGELLLDDGGLPVLVDYRNEPYKVRTRVGIALVATDGEVLFRYQDDYDALLSADNPLPAVSRQLARHLVADIAPLWLDAPDEPGASTLVEASQ